MKLLINFKLKPQGWSEIIDIPDNQNGDSHTRKEAVEKAQELLANRIINDGVKSIIETTAVTPIQPFITKVNEDNEIDKNIKLNRELYLQNQKANPDDTI
jgi:hypothetical protein